MMGALTATFFPASRAPIALASVPGAAAMWRASPRQAEPRTEARDSRRTLVLRRRGLDRLSARRKSREHFTVQWTGSGSRSDVHRAASRGASLASTNAFRPRNATLRSARARGHAATAHDTCMVSKMQRCARGSPGAYELFGQSQPHTRTDGWRSSPSRPRRPRALRSLGLFPEGHRDEACDRARGARRFERHRIGAEDEHRRAPDHAAVGDPRREPFGDRRHAVVGSCARFA